jgi:hypothetical protein
LLRGGPGAAKCKQACLGSLWGKREEPKEPKRSETQREEGRGQREKRGGIGASPRGPVGEKSGAWWCSLGIANLRGEHPLFLARPQEEAWPCHLLVFACRNEKRKNSISANDSARPSPSGILGSWVQFPAHPDSLAALHYLSFVLLYFTLLY